MEQARQFVDLTIANKHSEAENSIKQMIASRVEEALDARKRQVADQFYNHIG